MTAVVTTVTILKHRSGPETEKGMPDRGGVMFIKIRSGLALFAAALTLAVTAGALCAGPQGTVRPTRAASAPAAQPGPLLDIPLCC